MKTCLTVHQTETTKTVLFMIQVFHSYLLLFFDPLPQGLLPSITSLQLCKIYVLLIFTFPSVEHSPKQQAPGTTYISSAQFNSSGQTKLNGTITT